jgi:hypothetical protein
VVGGGRPLAWSVSAVVSVVGGGRPLAWSVSAVVSVVGGGRPLAWSVSAVVFRPWFCAVSGPHRFGVDAGRFRCRWWF